MHEVGYGRSTDGILEQRKTAVNKTDLYSLKEVTFLHMYVYVYSMPIHIAISINVPSA